MALLLAHLRQDPTQFPDAGFFLIALKSPRRPVSDKVDILHAFNNWDVLINFWAEVADEIMTLESLFDDQTFPARNYAALLASKVYFCLEQYDRSLEFALKSGDLFSVVPQKQFGIAGDSEFVNKLLEVAIDRYKKLRNSAIPVDSQLDNLIEKLVLRNLGVNESWFVIVLGFEIRRLDIIARGINQLNDENSMQNQTIMYETVQKALSVGIPESFRREVLTLCYGRFKKSEIFNLWRIFQCYIQTDKIVDIAALLKSLVADQKTHTHAYQMALDVYENSARGFSMRIGGELSKITGVTLPLPDIPVKDPPSGSSTPEPSLENKRIRNVLSILNGDVHVKQHLGFYIRHNQTDIVLLDELKDNVRSSVGHNAVVIANGFMHYGSTCDDFLRNNLPWIGRATNWNKFNATASLGLIHCGHEKDVEKILEPYLPQPDGIDGFGYKEGGALFAYGLIHAYHGSPRTAGRLLSFVKGDVKQPVRHGACLGLAVSALGDGNMETYQSLRDTLFLDEAVAGEAASIAMGFVMAGKINPEIFKEMKQYMVDTQHDKIQRGLRTGLAALAIGTRQACEPFVAEIIDCKSNPVLRSTGVLMLSLAYAATGNPDVVRRLLEKVAIDPNNDVKRHAACGLGFVLSCEYNECLSHAAMLVEHFNGYVRYGAAMSIGIACASSGSLEAIALLEPMISDKEGFVRKAAILATSMVMAQHNDYTCTKNAAFRRQLIKKVTEKNEETLVKMGAFIAQGILNIGGMNARLSMLNRDSNVDMRGTVGMLGFLHGWYWHSMYYMLSLAAKPNALIVLNPDLKLPKLTFCCNAKSYLFSYPPPIERRKEKETKRVETAVLSITGKKLARKDKRRASISEKVENMDTSSATPPPEKKDVKKPVVDNKSYHLLENPARVMQSQQALMHMVKNTGYKTLKSIKYSGIVVANVEGDGKLQELVAEATPHSNHVIQTADRTPHSMFEIDLKEF